MENPLTRIIRGGRKAAAADGQKSDRLTPDGLRITEFPPPVVQLLRLYGLSGSYAHLYAAQPNVRTVVSDLAVEGAELMLKMYLKDPRGALLADARIDVDHPMMDLLAEPEPGMPPFRFQRALFSDIGIYDIAHWRIVGTPPKALVRIPPAAIQPQYEGTTGRVREWIAMATGERIQPEELVTFWGYDPEVNHGSIPPLETLRRTLAEDYASSEDREARWSNSLRKDGVIEQDVQAPRMSDEARESFLTDAEEALSGTNNSYTPFMLEPGMRWRDTEWSPKEMEYLGARKLNRTEVAAAYHYPAAKVLATQNGTDPDKNTLDYFYQSTLPPYLKRVESEIMAQLLPKFELIKSTRMTFYVEFNLDAKLRGSFEQQAQIMATTAGGPVVLVNEARARLNLPPIEGGDQIFVPLNSMRGGGPQVSPQSPTDTPAVGLNPAGTTPTPLPEGGLAPAALPSGAASITPTQYALVPAEYAKEVLSPDAGDETIEEILAQHDRKMAGNKAANEHVTFMRETRARFEERHSQVFAKHFERQKNALKGGETDLASKRWNKELAQDLYGVSLQTVEHVGKHTAKAFGGDWSTERTDAYLHQSADANAQAINEGSQNILVSELQKHGEERIADLLRPGTGEVLEKYHEIETLLFGESRTEELAVARTTNSLNWGAAEAAHQNAHIRLNKTWFVTSRNPRPTHAQLDGATIPYEKVFPNGLRFPGDTAAGLADEVAGCQCVMSLSQAG